MIAGIDLNVERQLEWVRKVGAYYVDTIFPENATGETRFYLDNPNFSYMDAFFYYAFIRDIKPKRIIEVGCGYSSALVMDVNERHFQNSIDTTFIEPFPQTLYGLMRSGDRERAHVIQDYLQEVPLTVFADLRAGDILFIDSSHVSKTDSDLNHLLFYVLPALEQGVYIHFHDIFFPFEYPKGWVAEGRAFNECYVLRAFLMNNPAYSIELFSSYLWTKHRHDLAAMPLCCTREGGSLWLKKVGERSISVPQLNSIDKIRLSPSDTRSSAAPAVDLVHLDHPQQLGSGWHEYDKDLTQRWMADEAEIRLAGPLRVGQRLWLDALQPNRELVTITVLIDGMPAGAVQVKGPQSFVEGFALQESLVGKKEMLVTIRVDKILIAPGDPRRLGLRFGRIFID